MKAALLAALIAISGTLGGIQKGDVKAAGRNMASVRLQQANKEYELSIKEVRKA